MISFLFLGVVATLLVWLETGLAAGFMASTAGAGFGFAKTSILGEDSLLVVIAGLTGDRALTGSTTTTGVAGRGSEGIVKGLGLTEDEAVVQSISDLSP